MSMSMSVVDLYSA